MDIEKLKGVAIHCKTEKEAIECCNIADKLGCLWSSGDRFSSFNPWEDFGQETCYNFSEGTYCDKDCCRENECKIHSSKWFIKNFGNNK